MRLLIIILSAFTISGCVSMKKLPEICAEKFPTIVTDTVVTVDTLWWPVIDSFLPPKIIFDTITIDCPPSTDTIVITKIVTKTITNPATVIVTKLKVVPDSAKITVLNNQIDELKKENAELGKQIVEYKAALDKAKRSPTRGLRLRNYALLALCILLLLTLIKRK